MLGHKPDSGGDLMDPDHAVFARHFEYDGVVIGRGNAADRIRIPFAKLCVADDVVLEAVIGRVDHQRVRDQPAVVEDHVLGSEGSAVMPGYVVSQMENDLVTVKFPALGKLRNILLYVVVQLHQSAENGAALVEMLAACPAHKPRQMSVARGLNEAHLQCASALLLFHRG